ncbi:MAG: DUF1294 domain-containing protein [Clostridia bacterium]|nr:DUF1294 domain-containing protein [Clostridia bacterium]
MITLYLLYTVPLWLITVILTVYDKTASKTERGRKNRVPERLFWALALMGGAFPEYITMLTIRHKTRHKSFMWGLPPVIVLNFILSAAYILFL